MCLRFLLIAIITVLSASGCANVRPQARIIDGTNKGSTFSLSSEKHELSDSNSSMAVKAYSKERTFDFTF